MSDTSLFIPLFKRMTLLKVKEELSLYVYAKLVYSGAFGHVDGTHKRLLR